MQDGEVKPRSPMPWIESSLIAVTAAMAAIAAIVVRPHNAVLLAVTYATGA